MPANSSSTRLNATIINIHSPTDEEHSIHDADTFPRSSNASRQQQASIQPSPKVEEYRKIIQHIIGKILKRKKPPTALFHLSEVCRTSHVSDQFENDDTIDLLIQLRSALMVCHQAGLSKQVLIQGEYSPTATPISSKSNSPALSPRLGSSSRSAEAAIQISPNMLSKNKKKSGFETILHVLNDIVLNDCRFKTANPKPSRPPYTMQAILIDIALILVQIRDDSAGLYHIGTLFLPAFESFSDGQMLGRLLSFFLDSLLPKLMKCKDDSKTYTHSSQKHPDDSSIKHTYTKSQNNVNTPTINIQRPEQEQKVNTSIKISHLTIDTRLHSIDTMGSSPFSPAAHSSVNSVINNQSIDSYHAYALFTPLLYFMIQYLDPYLAAQSNNSQQDNLNYTLTRQANSIHNFYRALSYMISCKPDLYLDILDIISNSTFEVKFRACQILFYYYCTSMGHIVVADPLPPLGTQEELEILDQYREQQEFEEQHQNNAQFNQHSYRIYNNHRPQLTRQLTGTDSLEENIIEDHHIWFPHIFDQTQQKQSQSFEIADNYFHANANQSTFPLTVYDDMNESFCKECFKTIKGFGLRCYQCKGSIHYNCYNGVIDMKEEAIMFYVKAGGIQKVVTPQFCNIPPQLRFRDLVNRGIRSWTVRSNASKVGLLGHIFQLVNLYTLVICVCCGLPLWGISHQGYRCTECNRFIHIHCLAEAEEKNEFLKPNSSKNSTLHSFQTCIPFQPLLESDMKISQANLSKNFIEFYEDAVPTNANSLENHSFEEVSTILNILLLQEQILHYGIATGCVLVTRELDDPLLLVPDMSKDISENANDNQLSYCPPLTDAIKLCLDELKLKKSRSSTFLKDYYGDRLQNIDNCLLSKEGFLSHLSAMMKCLTTSFPSNNNLSPTAMLNTTFPVSASAEKRKTAGDSRGFLQVTSSPLMSIWDDEYDDFSERNIPNEYLDRSILLSWMMTNLNFKSRKNAEILLQHMNNLGLFERFDASPILFMNGSTKSCQFQEQDKSVQCVFPVPYSIDCSATVESLINSITACLQDIDLSINECGLLILVRRCWPDPFMSRYTQERLIHAIVTWAFDEDERLLALHAELTSINKNHQTHYNKQQNKWAQAALLSRMKGGNNTSHDRNRQSALHYNTLAGVNSGASSIYVTTRAALKDRYIIRWLAAIHDINEDAYTDMLFNVTEDIIDNKQEECTVPNWGEEIDRKKYVLQKYEQFIRYILKLKTNGFTFTSFENLLQKWLDRTYTEFNDLDILNNKEPAEIRHLVKLCSSRAPISKIPGKPTSHLDSANPIDIIMAQFSAGDTQSIERGMRWLTLIIHSGAGIPSNSLSQIARLIVVARTPLDITAEFVKAIWFQAVNNIHIPTSRATVIDIIGYLNEIALDTLKLNNESQTLSDASLLSAQTFIKYSAALACYAFECPQQNIEELGIVPYSGNHIINETNRRSAVHMESSTLSAANEKTPLIKCMLIYLQYDQLNVREAIIKMFYALCYWGYGMNNKNEFIAKCMPQLIPSIWELLTPTYDYLSSINLGLLMKIISIDVRYFHACVFKIFEDANWEVRACV
ncbi:uncharacterized protein BX663DRAFT_247120 [Cokeromyces recurvatus]|uniref:uncharacterized protein n=1 Tax=Cokeromyces recurvatus TaxID=90255 RepID=UPI0022202A24|nr:uncharacterized protein BX663DRAFT_247120 [Cokeromyces recurvatus]KAI7905964.1 hypothetical protein BX663DRAFT_247120 [Cokeromyces recurvatus]